MRAMPDLCLIDTSDPAIVIVTLNRPDKRNALSVELIERLTSAIADASSDPARRVLILRGADPVFCAGLDLQEASDPAMSEQSSHKLADLYTALCACPLVTIAAAQGAAFGGGAGLLAACDLVVAAENLRIGFPEVHRGLVAALVTCMVRRQLGERMIRELVLLGQNVPAARALALGLVNRVVPGAQLEAEATAVAREACQGAPGAIARTKRLLDDLAPRPIAEDLRLALKYHLEARDSAEAAEGVAGFLQKRPPRWSPARR
jgi:methylglutaconyl-CoA hydratase